MALEISAEGPEVTSLITIASAALPPIDITISSRSFDCNEVVVNRDNAIYEAIGNYNIIVESKTKKLIKGFSCSTIYCGVKSIGDYAFINRKDLKSIRLPDSVIKIGVSAFESCDSLEEVYLPGSIEEIGIGAFCDTALDVVDIPDNVKYIEKFTFADSGIRHVILPKNLVSIDEEAFSNNSIRYVDFPEGLTVIGNGAFSYNNLASIVIPKSVKEIGYSAFLGNKQLRHILVEKGNLDYDSRNNCEALIETKSNKLMLGCVNTLIPEGVVEITSSAFSNCQELESIVLPKSIKNIWRGALDKLEKVYYKGNKEEKGKIYIGVSNKTTWYYFSEYENKESRSGKWWYYDASGEIIEINKK